MRKPKKKTTQKYLISSSPSDVHLKVIQCERLSELTSEKSPSKQ